MSRSHSEDDLQMQVADYLNLLPSIGYYGWFHVPNGGKRNPREAGRFKQLGVKAGVPDIIIEAKTNGAPYGAFIELKAGKNTETYQQRIWSTKLIVNYGRRGALCRSLDEVVAALKTWKYVR